MSKDKAVNPHKDDDAGVETVEDPGNGEVETSPPPSYEDLEAARNKIIKNGRDFVNAQSQTVSDFRDHFVMLERQINKRIASPAGEDFPNELADALSARRVPKTIGHIIDECGDLIGGFEAALQGFDQAMEEAQEEPVAGDQTTFAGAGSDGA